MTPTLTPEIIHDDTALAEAVDEFIYADNDSKQRQAEILRLQDELRGMVSDDAWMTFLSIEERSTGRWADLVVKVGRWAFREGRRHPVERRP